MAIMLQCLQPVLLKQTQCLCPSCNPHIDVRDSIFHPKPWKKLEGHILRGRGSNVRAILCGMGHNFSYIVYLQAARGEFCQPGGEEA